ncbi:PREDICTED: plectin-like [Aptenodytes forsteri]|uniref:plectin-like n=1 Tax=Aptenodytes forsteri TaxID=9233 RepID=UPI0009058F56|nr:PREDICTED: plectin-like [Aptenodytes forsteri]
MTAKEKLLLWSQRMVEDYQGLRCDNFTTSWRDGRLFNAIIHRHKPMLIDMNQVYRQSNLENLDQAFTVAERDLGVTRLLDPEDVDVPQPDEKSIITYVSSLYDAMPRVPEVQDGVKANELQLRWQEYYEVVTLLLQWIRQHTVLFEERRFPASYEEIEVREPGRLERLQRIVSKLQMESGLCEEQLNQADTLLQSDVRLLNAGKPPQKAAEIERDLDKADAMIRLLFNDVQTLKDGRHPQGEQMYRRVYPLHARLVCICAGRRMPGMGGTCGEQGANTACPCARPQNSSKSRLRHLESLHGFVSAATKELMWLNEKEEEEVNFDWSDRNPNMTAKKENYSLSTPSPLTLLLPHLLLRLHTY